VEEGSGRRVGREIDRQDLMGKTGTTNGPTELWFTGANRDIATSVFVGFDQPQDMGESEQGATVPVPIWIDYMKVALAGTEEAPMIRPPGLVDRLIDKSSGASARPGQANTMFELFLADNAPLYAETGSLPEERDTVGDVDATSAVEQGSNHHNTPAPRPPRHTPAAPVEDALSTEIIF